MKIGDASALTGLSVSSIRFYEKKGLLQPVRDCESRYRDYTDSDVMRLKAIVVLRRGGISLEVIEQILHEEVNFCQVMKNQKAELSSKMAQIEAAVSLCDKLENEESVATMDIQHYFAFTEEEEQKGNRYMQVEEWLNQMIIYLDTVFSENILIASFLNHPKYRRIFLAIYFGLIPIVLVVIGVLGKSIFDIFAGLILYTPVLVYFLRRFLSKGRQRP